MECCELMVDSKIVALTRLGCLTMHRSRSVSFRLHLVLCAPAGGDSVTVVWCLLWWSWRELAVSGSCWILQGLSPDALHIRRDLDKFSVIMNLKVMQWRWNNKLYNLTEIKQSKLGSGRSERFETSFFRQVGHSLLPLRNAVMIQSEQKRCKHSFVVMVFLSISRQIGHLRERDKNNLFTPISALSIF